MKRTPLKRKTALKPKGKGLRKVRKDNITKLKKKLWQLCKEIIRNRYGNTCYTCYAVGLSGSNLHTGHFISSSICSTELRYSLSNLRPQCYVCNIHRSGNWIAFESHLRTDGIDVEALKQHNERTKGLKYDIHWFRAKIVEYEAITQSELSKVPW